MFWAMYENFLFSNKNGKPHSVKNSKQILIISFND